LNVTSERTAPSLAKLAALAEIVKALPAEERRGSLLEEVEALGRAVAAFHMEAIRFRMHAVDRLLRVADAEPAARSAFDELRRELEAAGFHTRSHAAP
jgi:hypothetical protein